MDTMEELSKVPKSTVSLKNIFPCSYDYLKVMNFAES